MGVVMEGDAGGEQEQREAKNVIFTFLALLVPWHCGAARCFHF